MKIEAVADDAALVDRLRSSLAAELRMVPGLETIGPERSTALPAGAKGDPMLIGSLIASGTFSVATLRAATRIALAWIDRAKARRVTLTYNDHRLDLQGASGSRQRAVTEAWLALIAEDGENPG